MMDWIPKAEKIVEGIVRESDSHLDMEEILTRYKAHEDSSPDIVHESQLNVVFWNLVSNGTMQISEGWFLEPRVPSVGE